MNKRSITSSKILKFALFFAVWLFSLLVFSEKLKYNFSYSLNGDNHGWLLFIIPYRTYYESFASVNFEAQRMDDDSFMFYFSDIPELGHMMRTSGFSGRSLVILTAGYNLNRSLDFSKKKLADFYKIAPYYSKFIKKKRPFLFKIFPNSKNSIRFKRDPSGKHSDFFIDFKLRFQYYPEVLNIDFNIYKILLEMLKVYNHKFSPNIKINRLNENPQNKWQSSPLNYSNNLNRIVRMAARIMKKLPRFRQKHDFELEYKINKINQKTIIIQGSKKQDLKIWGKFAIKNYSRKIQIRLKDNVLIEDSITIKIRNPKGNGLNAELSLKLIGK